MKITAYQSIFLGELSTKLNGEDIEKLKDVITTLMMEGEQDSNESWTDLLERYDETRFEVEKTFMSYFNITESNKQHLKKICAPTFRCFINKNILEEEE